MAGCHDRDRTYPYTPYPDLSTPIPSHLNHSRAPNTTPKPSDPLASQQRTPEHSDSLVSSQRIPDPTHLQPFLSLASSRFPTPTLIPTRRTLDLYSSSRQVDSRQPHSFPTRRLSTFTPLRQIYSRRFIGLVTAVGQSPIAYLPRSMRLSPSFLAPYIYVPLRSSVTSLTTLCSFSMSHPQFPVSVYPCFIYLYPLPPSTLFSYSVHFLRPIPDRSDQPDPYHTRTCINTLVTSCCSPV